MNLIAKMHLKFFSSHDEVIDFLRVTLLMWIIFFSQNFSAIPVLAIVHERGLNVMTAINILGLVAAALTIWKPNLFTLLAVYAANGYLAHADVGRDQFSIIFFWTSSYFILRYIRVEFPRKGILQGIFFVTCINIFFAGISKSLDPFWVRGWGFYYTFLQPWIKLDVFNFMMDSKFLMITMNWLTVIGELAPLPLLFLSKTRKLSVVLVGMMFLLLTFVFRIDAIGPTGLLISWAGYLSWNESYAKDVFVQIGKFRPRLWRSSFYLLPWVFILGIASFLTHRHYIQREFTFPQLGGSFVFKNAPTITPSRLQKWSDKMVRRMAPLEPWLPLYVWYTPFHFPHFVGRIYYSIEAYTSEEGKVDSVDVFNRDGTVSFWGLSGGVLKPRIWFDLVQYIQEFFFASYCVEFPDLSKSSSYRIFNELLERIRLASNAHEVRLLVHPIEVPSRYAGNIDTWSAIEPIVVASKRVGLPLELVRHNFRFNMKFDIPEFQQNQVVYRPYECVLAP